MQQHRGAQRDDQPEAQPGRMAIKPYAERGLPDADDAAVLAAMVADPILIERPLVETDKGVRLCRPQDAVLEIL
jgi:arsenate reductase